jgi:hypothetical protein
MLFCLHTRITPASSNTSFALHGLMIKVADLEPNGSFLGNHSEGGGLRAPPFSECSLPLPVSHSQKDPAVPL